MTRAIVRVRPAVVDDVPELVRLVSTVDTTSGVFTGKPPAAHDEEHLARRLHTIVLEPDRTLLMAFDDDEVVGMVATRTDEIGAIDLTPVLHVTHLLVLPHHRRRGTGRSLLVAAVQLAEELGLDHLLATASAGSREGNRYLARIGFAPLVLNRIAPTAVLRRSLGMNDVAGQTAVLRRARLARTQRARFSARAVGRGA